MSTTTTRALPDTTDLKNLLVDSSQMYLFFSQVIFKELSEETITQLASADYSALSGNKLIDNGNALIKRYFSFMSNDPRTELACEYARIFLASGLNTKTSAVATPYESVFTSEERLVMQEARDEVYRWYLQDGFKVDPSLHEPEDHLAFELEYLAHINERAVASLAQGDEGALIKSLQRQRVFIDEHLLNWLPQLRTTAQDYAKLTFYTGFLMVLEGYLQGQKELLDSLLSALSDSDLQDHAVA